MPSLFKSNRPTLLLLQRTNAEDYTDNSLLGGGGIAKSPFLFIIGSSQPSYFRVR